MGLANRNQAEAFPPGDYIREEMEARGWTKASLCGKPGQLEEIVAGTREITPEIAQALGLAFGAGPRIWLNLETAWQRFKNDKMSPGG